MKQKFLFGVQVFSTLILFFAIFITYLVRHQSNESISSGKDQILNEQSVEKNNSSGIHFLSGDDSKDKS